MRGAPVTPGDGEGEAWIASATRHASASARTPAAPDTTTSPSPPRRARSSQVPAAGARPPAPRASRARRSAPSSRRRGPATPASSGSNGRRPARDRARSTPSAGRCAACVCDPARCGSPSRAPPPRWRNSTRALGDVDVRRQDGHAGGAHLGDLRAHQLQHEIEIVDHEVEDDRHVGAARLERRQALRSGKTAARRGRPPPRANRAIEALYVPDLEQGPTSAALATRASAPSRLSASGFSISACRPRARISSPTAVWPAWARRPTPHPRRPRAPRAMGRRRSRAPGRPGRRARG